MHIAIGYRWYPAAFGYHLERALQRLGHRVTYVGTPVPGRSGYDSAVPIGDLVEVLEPQPDVYLWVDPMGRYFPKGIEDAPVPTACYLIDVHLGSWREQVAPFFDGVFVAQRDYLDGYRRAVGHDQVYWLPLAAAADVHLRHDVPRIYDVGFVGNLSRAHRGTPRARQLRLIAERFTTNDLDRSYTPEEVGRVYSASRIVFNTSIAGDVTMRVFEGAACGAMVLTDAAGNGLEQLFAVGRDLITFSDDEDLLRRLVYYLEHDEERRAIAEAGYRRVCEEHTFQHRAETLLSALSSPAFQRRAPLRRADAAARGRARRDVYTHLHMLDALFDQARDAGYGPLRRAWATAPCLLRRLLI